MNKMYIFGIFMKICFPYSINIKHNILKLFAFYILYVNKPSGFLCLEPFMLYLFILSSCFFN